MPTWREKKEGAGWETRVFFARSLGGIGGVSGFGVQKMALFSLFFLLLTYMARKCAS